MTGVVRASSCPHCGTAVEAPEGTFCCSGCELAARIISDAGLERYYSERTAYAPRPTGRVGRWDAAPVVECADGTRETTLALDGLRCASCVWVTERVLGSTPGVVTATVSYASGRTRLKWDPALTSLTALAGRIGSLGYQPRVLGEEARPDRELTLRLGVAVFAAMNVMLMAVALYAGWFSSMEPRFQRMFEWGSLLVATPAALWCAEPFFRGAWQGLANRTLHMDVPIAIAIATLYAHGVYATLTGGEAYLDSLTMLVALLLAGRLLESRGRRRAAEAATTLAASVPATARRVEGAEIRTVPADALSPGDLIEVGMGEEISADGHVFAGAGSVIMAVVTGESAPISVAPGDRVVAGGVLELGALTVRVESAGSDTVVHRMAQAVAEAADRPSSLSTVDRLAPWFTGVTLLVAALTFGAWMMTSGLGQAISATVAVLVVACPCALALSRPLAGVSGLGAAARRGTLFRSIDALLALAKVDTVALDKTGTVTGGDLVVTEASDRALRVAAGLERSSIHPVARAIVRAAVDRGIPLPTSTGVEEEPGTGIAGVIDGVEWQLRRGGPGRIELSDGGNFAETIRLGDTVRGDSNDAVAELVRLGVSVTLLTGDHADVARNIAARTGITEVHAAMSPERKAAWIEVQQGVGKTVLFVGDGVNDGPALATANVGLSMRSGAASSLLVADGVVVSGSLNSVTAAIVASRESARAVRHSQTRSVLYNVVAVAGAAAGIINPLTAAILMPLSSALVVLSAVRIETRLQKAGR